MQGKIKALTAQGRMQGLVMLSLPIIVGLALYKMDSTHKYMVSMFTEWYGWLTIAILLTLLSIGGFFIHKIVSIDI